jgi:hypothetical protein
LREAGRGEAKKGRKKERKKLSKKIVSANVKSCGDFFSSEVQSKTLFSFLEVQFKTLARDRNIFSLKC